MRTADVPVRTRSEDVLTTASSGLADCERGGTDFHSLQGREHGMHRVGALTGATAQVPTRSSGARLAVRALLAGAAIVSVIFVVSSSAQGAQSSTAPPAASGIHLSGLATALRQSSASAAAGDCNRDASYIANRIVYNNLGLASMLAGYSTNTVEWGFDHTSCAPVDETCFTFHNVDCMYDGCSWFESTEFSCKSLLHGHTYLFKNVTANCEVWAGLDSVPQITCSKAGLAAIDPASRPPSPSPAL
uniref:Uncharacterized protein n=1 Tax=Chrysotila carterae TaxID=13221 RepID=A0A7S4BKV2_CHRCT|mmetsp:Transcript_6219/g.13554  ORF Transcript_6219/g.13554 Transcript_6219/m.13554 type:complete len:246 (+) Transcript_6219:216-953(+)